MHNIGEMKLTGDGTEKDLTTSFNWYQKAAQYDLVDSQFMVGKMYEMGWGTQQSNQHAFDWYLKAALQDDGEAMVRMALLTSYDPQFGYELKSSIALLYLANYAEVNHAFTKLSEYMTNGILNDDDIERMHTWFEQTCSKESLGRCVADIHSNQLVRF
jgi:TPR repeat protein